jgi:hypothetical protein
MMMAVPSSERTRSSGSGKDEESEDEETKQKVKKKVAKSTGLRSSGVKRSGEGEDSGKKRRGMDDDDEDDDEDEDDEAPANPAPALNNNVPTSALPSATASVVSTRAINATQMRVVLDGQYGSYIVNREDWKNGTDDTEKKTAEMATAEWIRAKGVFRESRTLPLKDVVGFALRSSIGHQPHFGGSGSAMNVDIAHQDQERFCALYTLFNLYPELFTDPVLREFLKSTCGSDGMVNKIKAIIGPIERSGHRLVGFAPIKWPGQDQLVRETGLMRKFLAIDLDGDYIVQLTRGLVSQHCVAIRAVLGKAPIILDCGQPTSMPLTRHNLEFIGATGFRYVYKVKKLGPKPNRGVKRKTCPGKSKRLANQKTRKFK